MKNKRAYSHEFGHGRFKSYRFVFQDTDVVDIPVEYVKTFDIKRFPFKWIMQISGAADVMYNPFGVLTPIKKFWSLQNKNLTQLRFPDGKYAVDTYDNDDFNYDDIPQQTRKVQNDLIIGIPEQVVSPG